jgi:ketosteroid isomerase-like protein
MSQLTGIAIALTLLLAGASPSVAQTESGREAVRAANQAYYDALSARDIQAMEQVWSRTADDVLVAPPIRPSAHAGWDKIKKQYETFWATLEELTVSMEQPTIHIEGNVAWTFGTEHAKRRTKDGQASGGPNFGTNIFVKRDGRWLLVFHQAALMPQPPAEKAK